MKKMRSILALLLAMVMVLSMSTMAFAADGTEEKTVDPKISVTDLAEGDVVTYYQVIEWDEINGGWVFKAPFTSLSAADLLEITGDGTTAGTITQAMAKKIAAAATADAGTTDPALTGTTWEKADPAPGLYMVVIAAAESGVVYNPAFVSADYTQPAEGASDSSSISINEKYSDTAVAKKTPIIVGKTEEDSDSAIAAAIDSYVGQEVTFHITTTIPVFMPSFKNPSFDVTDKITDGVELDADSIVVTAGSAVEGTDYEIIDVTATGFTVSFDEEFLAANAAPVDVTIDYKGTLTSDAEFNVNQEENDVTVTYSNGPGEEKGAVKDKSNTYTFSIGAKLLGDEEKKTSEIVKVAVDKEGNYVTELVELDNEKKVGALPGAEFGLYTDEACTTLYTNDLTDGKFTTGDDGVITYLGLAAGKYYLKELSAPAGYIKDDAVHTIEISATYTEVEVTETDPGTGIEVTYKTDVLEKYTISYDGDSIEYEITNNGPRSEETTINQESFEVKNTEGVELPSTGSIGTTIFYVVGAILVLGAGVVLVTRRRMEAQ